MGRYTCTLICTSIQPFSMPFLKRVGGMTLMYIQPLLYLTHQWQSQLGRAVLVLQREGRRRREEEGRRGQAS